MGKMEIEIQKRTRNKRLQKIILQTIATAGIIGVGLLVPNVLGAFVKLGLIPKPRQKEFINRSRRRLQERGLVEYKGKYLRLTKKGEEWLRRLELKNYQVSKPRRWDGKWRVLIFDIPEYRRTLRDKVRNTLRSIGFARLQDSVWIYPYDCEDLVTLLKADFKIGKDLLYLIVESLENDKFFRKEFGLT